MTQTGTLEELNVKPGDVVVCVSHSYTLDETLTIGEHYTVGENYQNGYGNDWGPYHAAGLCGVFRIVSRATNSPDTPKAWGEMTDADKGALLLAHHEGQVIEYHSTGMNVWYKWNDYTFDDNACGGFYDKFAYRIKPEPVVETVTAYADPNLGGGFEVNSHCEHWPYRITFTTTDGKPDCGSIKMERIND